MLADSLLASAAALQEGSKLSSPKCGVSNPAMGTRLLQKHIFLPPPPQRPQKFYIRARNSQYFQLGLVFAFFCCPRRGEINALKKQKCLSCLARSSSPDHKWEKPTHPLAKLPSAAPDTKNKALSPPRQPPFLSESCTAAQTPLPPSLLPQEEVAHQHRPPGGQLISPR